ncbi:unnamed protein product [Prorocentrum cordatum]|uniref:AP2/ERF domain-containing protein n=1 Tax=Prorocentrum cordatum TaxID=2364126 RepID=A0ABN9UMD4_9DINO|nr:unnamed protein product [Polarella glacialis]
MKTGPDEGTAKERTFCPKDGSPEEVERARLAAVEALRGLQEEDRALGPISSGRQAERQSGVKHINWDKHSAVWRIQYKMENGQARGTWKQPAFRPKGESSEEVERARLAAVEALRRLEEEDLAFEPSGSGGPCPSRGRGEVPLLDGLFLVVGDDEQRRLQEQDGTLGPSSSDNPSAGPQSAERQSGVKHIHWNKNRQAWRVWYRIRNGPEKGTMKQPTFRPEDESPEEVEQARLAAVEALRRLEEEDRALAPHSSDPDRVRP